MTSFGLLSREEVEEIAERAWLHVGVAAHAYAPIEFLDSLAEAPELPPRQLEYRSNIHFVLSSEVAAFMRAAPKLLLRVSQTTNTRRDRQRAPLGRVDWPRTLAEATRGGPKGELVYQVISNETSRDVLANRLVRFVLQQVHERAQMILPRQPELLDNAADVGPIPGWTEEVRRLLDRAATCLAHPALRGIPSSASRQAVFAARAARAPGYQEAARAHQLLIDLFGSGDATNLLHLFRQLVLMPDAEDRAFELLVLFRVIAALERAGAKRRTVRLIGQGNGPIFVHDLPNRRVVTHFQGVPSWMSRDSRYGGILAGHEMSGGVRRPDIVVEFLSPTFGRRTIVIEAKCSQSAPTIRDGVFQLLGYLADYQLQASTSAVVLVAHGGVPSLNGEGIRVGDLTGLIVNRDSIAGALQWLLGGWGHEATNG